jgi:general nucleoside transport system permease protein
VFGAFFSVGTLISLCSSALSNGTPILFAALGEIYNERAGILNLGLEGTMLVGALAAFLGTYFTHSVWAGLLCAMVCAMLFNSLMALLSVTIRANQIIAGTGLTILAGGLCIFIFRAVFGIQTLPPQVEGFHLINFPLLTKLPVIGPILFHHNLLVYLSLALVPITSVILERTVFGLNIKAVGENPQAADAKGINVSLTRYLSLIIAGAYAGLGGAFLSIAFMSTYLDQMTAGRGFIAIAVVIFARWNPYRALGAALMFGLAESLQTRLQAIGVGIPYQFLLALPYILTVLVLISVSRRAEFPGAFTVPYQRGEK